MLSVKIFSGLAFFLLIAVSAAFFGMKTSNRYLSPQQYRASGAEPYEVTADGKIIFSPEAGGTPYDITPATNSASLAGAD